MQVAEGRLKIDPSGSDIPVHLMTPAEAQILSKGFEVVANGKPLYNVYLVGSTKRSREFEIARLREKYKNLNITTQGKLTNVVDMLYPGASPSLPETFADTGIPVLAEPPIIPPTVDDMPEPGDDVELNETETQRRSAITANEKSAFLKTLSQKAS
jgi:hypothetical protein